MALMSTGLEDLRSKEMLQPNHSSGSRTVSMLLDDYNDLETLPSRDNQQRQSDNDFDNEAMLSVQLKNVAGKAELRNIPGSIPLSSYPNFTVTSKVQTAKSISRDKLNGPEKSLSLHSSLKQSHFVTTIDEKGQPESPRDSSQNFVAQSNTSNGPLSSVHPINIISAMDIEPSSSDPSSQQDPSGTSENIPGDETLKESTNARENHEKEVFLSTDQPRLINTYGNPSPYMKAENSDYHSDNQSSEANREVKSTINIWKYIYFGTLAGAIVMLLVTASVKFINDFKLSQKQQLESNDFMNAFEHFDNATKGDLLKYFTDKYGLLQTELELENKTSTRRQIGLEQGWLTGPVQGVENNFVKINPKFKNDKEIQSLMESDNLKQTFYCLAYAPRGVIEPQCGANERDILLDVARMSKVTNKIRTYGTQCNQTAMILEAIKELHVNMTVSMGVWIGEDNFVNEKQIQNMRELLLKYPISMFDSIFVGNEVLFREDKSVSELVNLIKNVKDYLLSIGYEKIPVGTSELGSLMNEKIVNACDFISVNIHPFFSGISAGKAKDWTLNYLSNQVLPLLGNSHDKTIVISETGWPYSGGEYENAVANHTEMQLFLSDWICETRRDRIYSIYFEAFDEPWKEIFYEGSQKWETNWGFFDSARQVKKNITIPGTCVKSREVTKAFLNV